MNPSVAQKVTPVPPWLLCAAPAVVILIGLAVLAGWPLDVPTLTEINVIDTGIGINPDDQTRLFQSFAQIGGEPRRKNQGSGLGLHLSKNWPSCLADASPSRTSQARALDSHWLLEKTDLCPRAF